MIWEKLRPGLLGSDPTPREFEMKICSGSTTNLTRYVRGAMQRCGSALNNLAIDLELPGLAVNYCTLKERWFSQRTKYHRHLLPPSTEPIFASLREVTLITQPGN